MNHKKSCSLLTTKVGKTCTYTTQGRERGAPSLIPHHWLSPNNLKSARAGQAAQQLMWKQGAKQQEMVKELGMAIWGKRRWEKRLFFIKHLPDFLYKQNYTKINNLNTWGPITWLKKHKRNLWNSCEQLRQLPIGPRPEFHPPLPRFPGHTPHLYQSRNDTNEVSMVLNPHKWTRCMFSSTSCP